MFFTPRSLCRWVTERAHSNFSLDFTKDLCVISSMNPLWRMVRRNLQNLDPVPLTQTQTRTQTRRKLKMMMKLCKLKI